MQSNKAANKILGLPERLVIWQEMLCRKDGTTYNEFCERCQGESDVPAGDYEDCARKDIEFIQKLISKKRKQLSTKKEGKTSRYFLSKGIDLCAIYRQQKVGQLMEMLVSAEGILPKDFLSSLSSVYKDLYNKTDDEGICVFFESDYTIMEGMDHFTTIYKALRKHGLIVTRHRAHAVDKKEKVMLFPEILKQYKSTWYVYGTIMDESGKEVLSSCGRIPLAFIDKLEKVSRKQHKFVASGTDYIYYFDEVVGLENDENCPIETVKLLVREQFYERLATNPIHGSQASCSDYEKKGYRCIRFKVRKNKELIRALMSFGSDIIVLEPEPLKRDLLKEIQKTQRNYLP